MTLPYSKKISHFVLSSVNEKGEKVNVIEFYNKIFLVEMKEYIKRHKDNTINTTHSIFATPRPIIPSLITNSPLKQYTNIFTSPFRKTIIEPNMTPFSAALYVKDDPCTKLFRNDFENPAKKLDLSRTTNEKPNNSLLNKLKNKYEGNQPTLHLKSNSKLLTEGDNGCNLGLSRSLSRSLFGENSKIEESEENSVNENFKND